MKFLTLNCQHGEQPALQDFLHRILEAEKYDFLLIQEVSETVLAFLHHLSYRLVRSFNEETGQDSELCIAYREKYHPLSTGFKSFAAMRKDPVYGFKHPAFGLLWADFGIGSRIWRTASLHLHSGADRHVRILRFSSKAQHSLKTASGVR